MGEEAGLSIADLRVRDHPVDNGRTMREEPNYGVLVILPIFVSLLLNYRDLQ